MDVYHIQHSRGWFYNELGTYFDKLWLITEIKLMLLKWCGAILQNDNLNLRPEKIKDGWLKHIKNDEENYLWVSNQRAFDLMKKGVLPPETSSPNNNEFYEMIDAQLTTEIFGLYSPNYPDIGLRMAYMPIRTVARENAAWISEFYIIMHS